MRKIRKVVNFQDGGGKTYPTSIESRDYVYKQSAHGRIATFYACIFSKSKKSKFYFVFLTLEIFYFEMQIN